jgi:oxygen-dependent protoporphyrinogen oxidase
MVSARQIDQGAQGGSSRPEWPEFEYGTRIFQEGLGTLPNAIAKELGDKVELQWKVTKIERRITVLTRQPLKLPMECNRHCCQEYCLNRSSPFLANVLEPVMPESKSIFRKVRLIDRIYLPPTRRCCHCRVPQIFLQGHLLDNGFGNLQDLPGFEVFNPERKAFVPWVPLDFLALPGRCPPDYNLLLNYIGGFLDTPRT